MTPGTRARSGAARPATGRSRLNEAVSLCALFEVPFTQLLAPLPLTLREVDREIAAVEEQVVMLRAQRDEFSAQRAAVTFELDGIVEQQARLTQNVLSAEVYLERLRRTRAMLEDRAAQ